MLTKEELLDKTQAFLFDLDGTLYLDESPIGDSAGTLRRLRAMGKRIVFLTNNSSRTEAQYREKLIRVGLFEAGDLVYTSGMAAISFLSDNFRGKRVYLLGTAALKEEFRENGIELTEERPDVCLLAYDVELTFEKIRRFDSFLKDGAAFFATHPDDVCPTAGHPMPDVGSFLAMFERSSGRKPDLILGKPFRPMGEGVSRLLALPTEKICMAGDRMQTDIRFANNNGMTALLVLSGETTRENIGNFPDRPDLILDTVNDLFG